MAEEPPAGRPPDPESLPEPAGSTWADELADGLDASRTDVDHRKAAAAATASTGPTAAAAVAAAAQLGAPAAAVAAAAVPLAAPLPAAPTGSQGFAVGISERVEGVTWNVEGSTGGPRSTRAGGAEGDGHADGGSSSLAAEVAAAWLALSLVAAGVVYAQLQMSAIMVMLGGLEDPESTGEGSLRQEGTFVDVNCTSPGGFTSAVARLRIENLIGAAPLWMRNTLLSAFVVKAAGRLFGFTGQKKKQKMQQQHLQGDGQDSLPASVRASVTSELLASLLQDERLGSRVEEIAAVIASRERELRELTVEQERDHARELQLAVNQGKAAGLCGLLWLLLTGHGLKPAPRAAAGWAAITDDATAQSTWHEARDSLGLTAQQAVGVSVTKLLLWHWSQPVAFLLVYWIYFCQLTELQRAFGLLVATREVLYIATTLAGVLVCPVYLLLDVATVWAEADSRLLGCWRLAVYIMAPHNYVALCLAARFSERGAPPQPRHLTKMAVIGVCMGCAGFFVVIVLAVCVNDREHCTKSSDRGIETMWLTVWWPPLLGVFLFVVVSRNARHMRRTVAARAADGGGTELAGISTSAADGGDTELAGITTIASGLDRALAENKQQQLRRKGVLSRSFLGLAFAQILADFSSCFALGVLLQQWALQSDVPTAMIWGYTITACGFLLLFGPASVVASFKRASERASETDAATHCCGRTWDMAQRAAAGCFGGAMLLGLVYIAVGAVLLAIGSDVSCTGFTGTTEREWQAQCDWPRGRCVTGACVDFSNRAALLAFKASGNGDGLGSWVNGSNPCVAWAGVTCGGGVVTQLHRDPATAASSLTGDVGQLAALSQLTVLSLSSTAVSGDVGPLAVLAQLTDLGLYNTAVSGDVGPLAALTRLTFLDLGGTNVTGCPLRLANGKSCIVATVASRARLHLSE